MFHNPWTKIGEHLTSAPRQAYETSETGAALRRASDQVLQRTLEKRLKAPRGPAPRPGPAVLTTVADRDILAELVHRHPQRAERLHAQFAPLAHAA